MCSHQLSTTSTTTAKAAHKANKPTVRKSKALSTKVTKAKAASANAATNFTNAISEVRPYDIICGRSKKAFNNVGNRRFRITIAMNLQAYEAAESRTAKGELIQKLTVHLLGGCVGMRFLRPITGTTPVRYTQASDKYAREKVGHALRDLSVSQNTPSPTKPQQEEEDKKIDEPSTTCQVVEEQQEPLPFFPSEPIPHYPTSAIKNSEMESPPLTVPLEMFNLSTGNDDDFELIDQQDLFSPNCWGDCVAMDNSSNEIFAI